MVGTMLLMKMLHCRNNAERIRDNRGEGSSQKDNYLSKKIKYEPFSHDTCRICLQDGKLAIFGANGSKLRDSIHDITGIDVTMEDPYPKCLCQSCFALLQGAVLFKRTAIKSEQKLKKVEPEPNSEIFSTYEAAEPSSDDADDSTENEEEQPKSPYTCFTCDLNFKSYEDFTTHRKDCQQNIRKTWSCRLCDKVFDKYQDYAEHKQSIQHENLRITCKVCKKSFSHKYYHKHKVIHEEEAPYMCDICGKKFTAHSHFSRHRLTHFYDLPYKCSICPYRGRFPESLKMHMRTHTGEKPYQCEQCPSRFISKSNLNKHVLTHKKVKDFRCEVCGKGFYTKRELDLHIKADHSGVRDHVCRFCGKSFGYRKQMMKHELKVHKREKMKSGRMPIYLKVESMKQNEEELSANQSSTVTST